MNNGMNHRYPERIRRRDAEKCACDNCACDKAMEPICASDSRVRRDPPEMNDQYSRRKKRRMENFYTCNKIARYDENPNVGGCACGGYDRDQCACDKCGMMPESRQNGGACGRTSTCFESSQTYKNLETAFAGEAMARDKYAFFAGKAAESGYQQISDIFLATAVNELEHAEIWYKYLFGDMPSVEDCLINAAKCEQHEWGTMYTNFAETARAEGYYDIARKFEEVAAIEAHHEERYRKLYKNMVTGEVFCKEHPVMWICQKCGNQHCGDCAPMVCPVCGEPQAFQEIKCENY